MRQGALTLSRARLAAQLGDPAAQQLTGAQALTSALPTWRERAWKQAFRAAGRRPLVLVAWLTARDALDLGQRWTRRSQHLGAPRLSDLQHLRRVLEAVAAWFERPSRGRRQSLLALRGGEDTWDPAVGDLAGQRLRLLTVRLIDAVVEWPACPAVRDVIESRNLLASWAQRWKETPQFQANLEAALLAWLLEGQLDWRLPPPPRTRWRPEPAPVAPPPEPPHVPTFVTSEGLAAASFVAAVDPVLAFTFGVGSCALLGGLLAGEPRGIVVGAAALVAWLAELLEQVR